MCLGGTNTEDEPTVVHYLLERHKLNKLKTSFPCLFYKLSLKHLSLVGLTIRLSAVIQCHLTGGNHLSSLSSHVVTQSIEIAAFGSLNVSAQLLYTPSDKEREEADWFSL